MASADLAVAAARDAGYTVQTIIALDNATEATTEYFHQPDFDHWERWVMDEGDLGRVRNALVPRTDGRYHRVPRRRRPVQRELAGRGAGSSGGGPGARRAGHRSPRGERRPSTAPLGLHQNVDQDSPLFTPYFLYVRNSYDSLCLTPREAHLDGPVRPPRHPQGLSWQDWQFAIETMSRGWEHVVVPDTIIFKRRRDFSLMVESAGRKSLLRSLPEMAIDQVRDLPHLGGD